LSSLTDDSPTEIGRDYGRRLYVPTTVDPYVDAMQRVTDKEVFNRAVGKQSELKKPYDADSYEGMEYLREETETGRPLERGNLLGADNMIVPPATGLNDPVYPPAITFEDLIKGVKKKKTAKEVEEERDRPVDDQIIFPVDEIEPLPRGDVEDDRKEEDRPFKPVDDIPETTEEMVPPPKEPPVTPYQPPIDNEDMPPPQDIPERIEDVPVDYQLRMTLTTTLAQTADSGDTIIGTGSVNSWLVLGFWEWTVSSTTEGITVTQIRGLDARRTRVEFTLDIGGLVSGTVEVIVTATNTLSADVVSATNRIEVTQPSIVINGDMELNSNWTKIFGTAFFTAAQSSTQNHTEGGTYSWRIEVTDNGALSSNYGIKSDAFLPATVAGNSYKVSGWFWANDFRVTSPWQGQITIGAIEGDGSGIKASTTFSGANASGANGEFTPNTWTFFEFEYTESDNGGLGRTELWIHLPNGLWTVKPIVYFDDIRVVLSRIGA